MKYALIALFFLSGLPTYSQVKEPSRIDRNCRIFFPERPKSAPKLAYLYDGSENHQVSLPTRNFSSVVDLPKGELTLMLVMEAVTDPENLPAGAPILRIGKEVREFYILIVPDPTNKIFPYSMKMINAGTGKFGLGKTLWTNLSEIQIFAKLGESKVIIPPKKMVISGEPRAESGHYRAEIAYQHKEEKKFRRITEQLWYHDAGSRHLGFIVPTGGRLPKLYFLRDWRFKGGDENQDIAEE